MPTVKIQQLISCLNLILKINTGLAVECVPVRTMYANKLKKEIVGCGLTQKTAVDRIFPNTISTLRTLKSKDSEDNKLKISFFG